jgi:Uma2 family endonuclease
MSTDALERLKQRYARAAQAYLRSLPLEHFMESTPQATQRKIFVESADLVEVELPQFHHFNELLVQYDRGKNRRPGQVVPDNMVVLHRGTIDAEGSYDVEIQPAGPFWVLEYVSKSNPRKDYEDNLVKYERDLKVPYYLLFRPDIQELILYHHNGKKYVSVKPNESDRYPIPEVQMEVAIHEGWVRFWFRGRLLPLPADLLRELHQTQRELEETRQLLEQEQRARQAAEDELARLRAQLQQPGRRPRKKP